MEPIERVRATAGGRRLLALVADPYAEKSRRPHRTRFVDGPLDDRVALGSDALVDLMAGREPRTWTLLADDPELLAAELRRRIRGQGPAASSKRPCTCGSTRTTTHCECSMTS